MSTHKEFRHVLVHTHQGEQWGVCRFDGPGREPSHYGERLTEDDARNDGYNHMEFLFGYGQGFDTHRVDTEVRDVSDWRETTWEDE